MVERFRLEIFSDMVQFSNCMENCTDGAIVRIQGEETAMHTAHNLIRAGAVVLMGKEVDEE